MVPSSDSKLFLGASAPENNNNRKNYKTLNSRNESRVGRWDQQHDGMVPFGMVWSSGLS